MSSLEMASVAWPAIASVAAVEIKCWSLRKEFGWVASERNSEIDGALARSRVRARWA